jgi:hypothetical protein
LIGVAALTARLADGRRRLATVFLTRKGAGFAGLKVLPCRRSPTRDHPCVV